MPASRRKYPVVTVEGTLENIRRGSREDGSEYWVLTIDGKKYSTYDSEHVSYIQEGEKVEFSYTYSGSFKRIIAIRRLGSGQIEARTRPEALRIVRMNCLRTAAEMIRDAEVTPGGRADLVIVIAKRLEEHVLHPEDGLAPNGSEEARP